MDTPAPQWERTRLEKWLLALLLLFFVALAVQYTFKATQGDGHRSAILRWRQQLLSLSDGEDIYPEDNPYPNPPIMALILLPVATWPDPLGLPPAWAALGWFALKVGMTLLALRWVFRMVETPQHPFPPAAKVLTVLLSLRTIAGDLSHGNVNLFILFLVVASLYAYHHGRDFLAGVVLALAIACKVTPALFVGYFVWKRSWAALAGVAAGMVLFFWPGLLPACVLGWEKNLDQTTAWLNSMVKPFGVYGVVTSEHYNRSLTGLAFRLLTGSPSVVRCVHWVWSPVRLPDVLSLDPGVAKWIVRGFLGLFVVLVAWCCRTRRDGPAASRPALAAEYSMVMLGMLLFSERTWKHHCVVFILPFAVLSYQLVRQ